MIDLTNQIFGEWRVLKYNAERSKWARNTYWDCECLLCHQIVPVRATQLKNGRSTKCTACARLAKRISELDKHYGQLKVIEGLAPKNNRMMWLCECSCGNRIAVSGTDLRMGKVQSCGKCPDRRSLGEKEISSLLENNNIEHIIEYSFNDFIYDNGMHPRFDFYLPKYNCVIEYDGRQHFNYQDTTSIWNTKENYLKTRKRDQIKNNYCFTHNISIIRIPYTLQGKIQLKDLLPETSIYLLERKEI